MDRKKIDATSNTLLLGVLNLNKENEAASNNKENETASSTSVPNQVELNRNNEETESTSVISSDQNNEATASTILEDQTEWLKKQLEKLNELETMTSALSDPTRKIKNHLQRLKELKTMTSQDIHCSICLKKMTNMQLAGLDCCDHIFHIHCISEWSKINNICPLDRQPITKFKILEKSAPLPLLQMDKALNFNVAELKKATLDFKEKIAFLDKFRNPLCPELKNNEESSSSPPPHQ